MKRTLALIVLLASGMVLSASAQTPAAAPAGPTKVAVIAFQMAVGQTNEGQRDFADLMKKFEPRRAKLKALNDEVESLTKQLQAQGDKLAPAEQQSRAAAIETKKKQLEREAEDAQNDLQQEEQQLYATLASKVYDVLQTYVEQQGYTVVFDVTPSQQQQQQVLYAAPSTVITKAIIDAYNAKSGVPAPPTVEAPKPAPARRPAAK
jgi:outer membrane protein